MRRLQAEATRERIVTAAADLLRGGSIRDWAGMTIRAVAERAGVNERTVYRHFANERGLRDAVMRHLEEAAGIDLVGMRLEDVAEVTTRILEQVSSFPLEQRPPLDPTLAEAHRRQHRALLEAVTAHTERWPAPDRVVVAALLDSLWGVATYERLVVDWQLDPARAIAGIAWMIELVEDAVRKGRRPGQRAV